MVYCGKNKKWLGIYIHYSTTAVCDYFFAVMLLDMDILELLAYCRC
jgi:hypothetical protein